MPHVGRKREHRHVGRDRSRKKIHVVTGHIEWEPNAPKGVKRFEVIQMHNPDGRKITNTPHTFRYRCPLCREESDISADNYEEAQNVHYLTSHHGRKI